ncbi:hypothetical protein DL96DRAFT_117552 [Flagelloscypha sp. PMI_526]|nr:hypothetical protein DL96DRAFT_117552 [Flagelloscypha sp. PMI_526]
MKIQALLISLAIAITSVSAQGCTTPAGKGTCKYTSSCTLEGYFHYAGYCPGPANYQCCVHVCNPCPALEQKRRAFEERAGVKLEARFPCC